MKYIIDIPKTVGMLEAVGSVHYTYFDGIQVQTIVLKGDEIEELNSDYINEHFGDMKDTAYQRGLEDGKWKAEDGCTGCMWEGNPYDACEQCCNAYKNLWTAKDDKIEVGDEVNWLGDCFIVTRIFQPHNMKEQCDGIDDDGCVYHDVLMDDLEKTGNHYDIASILKEMQND